jgi:hypothetical protein
MRDFYVYMMREFPRLLEGWQREIEDAAGASRN